MITHRVGSWVGNNVSKERNAAIFKVLELFPYHSSRNRCNFLTLMMEAARSPKTLVINLRSHKSIACLALFTASGSTALLIQEC
jgi:hypothetical protein